MGKKGREREQHFSSTATTIYGEIRMKETGMVAGSQHRCSERTSRAARGCRGPSRPSRAAPSFERALWAVVCGWTGEREREEEGLSVMNAVGAESEITIMTSRRGGVFFSPGGRGRGEDSHLETPLPWCMVPRPLPLPPPPAPATSGRYGSLPRAWRSRMSVVKGSGMSCGAWGQDL